MKWKHYDIYLEAQSSRSNKNKKLASMLLQASKQPDISIYLQVYLIWTMYNKHGQYLKKITKSRLG